MHHSRNSQQQPHGRGLSINVVHMIKEQLNNLLNFAVESKFLTENPASNLRLPARERSRADSFTFEEFLKFVSVKEDFWYGDAFTFQLHTGLRNQELMSLIWADIDWKLGSLRIERACKWVNNVFVEIGSTKNKRSVRNIKLEPEHLELLAAHHEKQKKHVEELKRVGAIYGEPKIKEWLSKNRSRESHLYTEADLIFPNPIGQVPNMKVPRTNFKAMLRKAGFIENRLKLRWYDLRHTHATFLLTLGVPDHEVAGRMGHTTAILQETYAHIIEGRQRVASGLFAALLPVKSPAIKDSSEIKSHLQEAISRLEDQGSPVGLQLARNRSVENLFASATASDVQPRAEKRSEKEADNAAEEVEAVKA